MPAKSRKKPPSKRKSKPPKRTKRDNPTGVFRAGEAYHAADVMERLNISQRTLSRMKKRGLKTCLIGGFAWILSDDILDYMKDQGRAGQPDV